MRVIRGIFLIEEWNRGKTTANGFGRVACHFFKLSLVLSGCVTIPDKSRKSDLKNRPVEVGHDCLTDNELFQLPMLRLMLGSHDRDLWMVVPRNRKEGILSTSWPLIDGGRWRLALLKTTTSSLVLEMLNVGLLTSHHLNCSSACLWYTDSVVGDGSRPDESVQTGLLSPPKTKSHILWRLLALVSFHQDTQLFLLFNILHPCWTSHPVLDCCQPTGQGREVPVPVWYLALICIYLFQPCLWSARGQLLWAEDLSSSGTSEKTRNSVGLGPRIHLSNHRKNVP